MKSGVKDWISINTPVIRVSDPWSIFDPSSVENSDPSILLLRAAIIY